MAQVYEWADPSSGIKYTLDITQTHYVKGILFMTFSGEYDSGDIIGENTFYDEIEELCRENSFAYLGARLSTCEIRESFDRAIEYFASESHHPEIRTAPLIIEGLSYGVEYATCLSYTQFQDKIIAYIAHSGWHPLEDFDNSNLYKIPALWITGGLNEDGWVDRISELFYSFRSRGAFWTLAIIPGMGHERGDNEIVMSYIDTLMDMRFNKDTRELIPLDEGQNLLGNNISFEYFPYDRYSFSIDSSSWLPSEKFAETWKKFVSGNYLLSVREATDTPSNVLYNRNESKIYISTKISNRNIIQLIDCQGRVLITDMKPSDDNESFTLETGNLNMGIYFVRITNSTNSQIIPILIY